LFGSGNVHCGTIRGNLADLVPLHLQEEFYASAFRKKLYTNLEKLQTDLDDWLTEYNRTRPHSGRYCYGKTPMQTFLDSVSLAREKMLELQLFLGALRKRGFNI
jgi:hypothetical protein